MSKFLTALDPTEYEHELDKNALNTLEKIPGLPKLTKKFYELGFEKLIRIEYTGQYLFIGDNITDFYAAQNANIDFCLVLTGHGLKARDKLKNSCEVYENLLECVKDFLVNSKKIYSRDIN